MVQNSMSFDQSFDQSPLFLEPDEERPPIFWPQIWRTVLSCFNFGRAMTVDLQFGAIETDWLMEERMSGVPSSHTWLLAAYEHSIGLMMRLQNFGVPCAHIDDIVQFAVSHNQLDTLVLFTSTQFVFRGLDGHPVRDSKFVPRIDKAVRRGYHEVVKYCVWRYEKQKERLLKRPLESLVYLMDHNYSGMFKIVVPSLLRVGHLHGLRLLCQHGHLKLLQYAVEHLDPLFSSPENLSDELMVLAAKHGHLPVLRFLKNLKSRFIPRKAYQQAFSWGRMEICRYILQRFPDYRPEKFDILDACAHGHVEAIESLPAELVLPDECMERAVKSCNPKMIYTLHHRMSSDVFKMALLHEAIHSKNSDVCLAIFDCGEYKRLPINYDIELTRNRMRKALKVFHSLGFEVYTERAFLEACRICCLEIIRDIMTLPAGQRPDIMEATWTTALCAIQVSPEIRNDKRIEAHDYVNSKFQEFKAHPELYVSIMSPCIVADEPLRENPLQPLRPKPASSQSRKRNVTASNTHTTNTKKSKHVQHNHK